MTFAIVVTIALAFYCLVVAGLPASARRRVADGDADQLDLLMRTHDRATSPLPGAVTLAPTLAAAVVDVTQGEGAWPVWLLASALAVAQIVLARRSRTAVRTILVEGGAAVPDPTSARAVHVQGQRRLISLAVGLLVAAFTCQVLARLDVFQPLLLPSVGLSVAFVGVMLAVGWRGFRGPQEY